MINISQGDMFVTQEQDHHNHTHIYTVP